MGSSIPHTQVGSLISITSLVFPSSGFTTSVLGGGPLFGSFGKASKGKGTVLVMGSESGKGG